MSDKQSEGQFFAPSENQRFSCDLRFNMTKKSFAAAYYYSAKLLVESVYLNCALSDTCGPPIAYLYRQFIELMFKEIRRLQTGISGKEELKGGHRIVEFWEEIKKDFDSDFIDQHKEYINVTDLCVTEFCTMDPKGDAFRYPEPIPKQNASSNKRSNENSTGTFRDQRSFDVVNLGTQMKAVEYFLCILMGRLEYEIEIAGPPD